MTARDSISYVMIARVGLVLGSLGIVERFHRIVAARMVRAEGVEEMHFYMLILFFLMVVAPRVVQYIILVREMSRIGISRRYAYSAFSLIYGFAGSLFALLIISIASRERAVSTKG